MEPRPAGLLGTASGDAVPGGVTHRRVAPRDSTVPRQYPSPVSGCGTREATAPPRTMSRLQSCVATDWGILLRPGVGEGRNNLLTKRSVRKSAV